MSFDPVVDEKDGLQEDFYALITPMFPAMFVILFYFNFVNKLLAGSIKRHRSGIPSNVSHVSSGPTHGLANESAYSQSPASMMVRDFAIIFQLIYFSFERSTTVRRLRHDGQED